MPRYALLVEYDGTPFVGWQRQANGLAVQQALEEAVTRLTGEEARVQGAGRTDAGVHAIGQVAHVDVSKEWPAHRLRAGLNFHLRCWNPFENSPVGEFSNRPPPRAPAQPPDIMSDRGAWAGARGGGQPVVVREAARVDDDFHARFSAVKRHYLYRILNRPAPPALERGRVWHVPVALDAAIMHEAAQVLVGRHDFTTFRASQCQAESPVKTLDAISVTRAGEEIHIRCSARSFLHNQVRSIAGSLKLVGEGKWTAGDLRAALEARDRTACGPVAPAAGLYLVRVDYPHSPFTEMA